MPCVVAQGIDLFNSESLKLSLECFLFYVYMYLQVLKNAQTYLCLNCVLSIYLYFR